MLSYDILEIFANSGRVCETDSSEDDLVTNTYKYLQDPIEAAIIDATIDAIAASSTQEQPLKLGVYDGEETSCRADRLTPFHLQCVRDAIAATDETTLIIQNKDGQRVISMFFVHGNGADVLSDMASTTGFDDMLDTIASAANAVAYPKEAPSDNMDMQP
jgi:hypothetical protein